MNELDLKQIGIKAKKASHTIARVSTDQKNKVLENMLLHLKVQKSDISRANEEDQKEAKSKNLDEPLISRLKLNFKALEEELEILIALPDPVGELFDHKTLENQLKTVKCRTPIGVIGVIYESRPSVTVDVAALCLKSGNGAILRGGSESRRTNNALIKVVRSSLEEAGLPPETIQLIDSPDRSYVLKLLHLHDYIDLIIPRGGASLHTFCRENSTIPVITGGIGICHLFADETLDQDKSLDLILNAKTQSPAVCNALDTLLIHEKVASEFLPKVVAYLKNVAFKLDPVAFSLIKDPRCTLAVENDWDTEWLGLTLGIKIVKNLTEAIEHIQLHSSSHSDGILTENQQNADIFVRQIDSAAVYVNASTRFTDGGEMGLGAEVAISTQKLHARGPMGLKELTSYKWIIRGDYQIRK